MFCMCLHCSTAYAITMEEPAVLRWLFERRPLRLCFYACGSSFGDTCQGSSSCKSCAVTRQVLVYVVSVWDSLMVCDLTSWGYFCWICGFSHFGALCVWISSSADLGFQSISYRSLEIAGWNREQRNLQLRVVWRGFSLSTPGRRVLGSILEDPSAVASPHGGQLLLCFDTVPGLWGHSHQLHRQGKNCRRSQRSTSGSQFAGHCSLARGLIILFQYTVWGLNSRHYELSTIIPFFCVLVGESTWVP